MSQIWFLAITRVWGLRGWGRGARMLFRGNGWKKRKSTFYLTMTNFLWTQRNLLSWADGTGHSLSSTFSTVKYNVRKWSFSPFHLFFNSQLFLSLNLAAIMLLVRARVLGLRQFFSNRKLTCIPVESHWGFSPAVLCSILYAAGSEKPSSTFLPAWRTFVFH